MKKEIRTIVYDKELQLEAYRLQGIVQPFPNHFHDFYVIGLVMMGERRLSCKNREYLISKGSILMFNPGDNHSCIQSDGCTLDYGGLNIKKERMLDLTEEITGIRQLPGFSQSVIFDEEAVCYLRPLHEMIMTESEEFAKEEDLILLLTYLIQNYGQPFEQCIPDCSEEIELACSYIKKYYMERIGLDQICREAGLSKSTLLRAFTKSKGITPYRYLETIRIDEAKKLLEQGMPPVEAAMRTGFSDQSHFTNYFSSYIGISPGAYGEIFKNKNQAEEK